jgi:putative tryptophan/tyrosine transport system substrate-binding protein
VILFSIFDFRFWIERIKRQTSFCLVLGSLLVVIEAVAEGQQPERMPRIGYLASFGSPDASPGKHQLNAFRKGLRDLGYIEGKTIRLDYRYPKDNPEQAPELAADLVRQKVDILIAVDSSAIRATKQATKTVPIVMITNQDPVAAGFVDSLAVPGGNVTGITRLTRELSGKRLELLRDVVPSGTRVAVLWVRPTALGTGTGFKNYENAAQGLKLQLHSLPVQRPNPDIDGAFEAAVKARANALVIVSNAVLRPHAKQIADLAIKNRLASICEASQYVDAGCLVSYATDDTDSYRRVAIYVDKILKGARPADLPVEQPTKFELVINLKTAKQIGVTIPAQVLARADKVIK